MKQFIVIDTRTLVWYHARSLHRSNTFSTQSPSSTDINETVTNLEMYSLRAWHGFDVLEDTFCSFGLELGLKSPVWLSMSTRY